MQEKNPYFHRDLSWLSFNERVLQEAKDSAVPLFERLKFLAIYSNNLEEFFRVRVANHRNLLRVGKKTKKQLDYAPKEVLRAVQKIVDKQQEEFSRIFEKEIIPQLKKHGISLKRRLDLKKEQSQFIEDYFYNHMLPFVQPVLLNEGKVRPFLNNGQLYMMVHLRDNSKDDLSSDFALVKIPSDHLPRFIQLPANGDQNHLIMLDDIVRHSISSMFPGYEILDTYSIKLTRDAELYIDDEFSGDLIGKIRSSLSKRHVGPASRFVFDRKMPDALLEYVKSNFELTKYDVFAEGRYHNNRDFFGFPTFGMTHLQNLPLPPISYKPLEKTKNFFESIRDRDHMIHVPYHSYESTVRFFEEAAKDPNVTHIKIVQYRVAKKSRIMEAIKAAVKAGKQVFAFIEVKARFDEEANLNWGEILEKAGVNVNYSMPGLKVHSKLALVRRLEGKSSRLYAYMSTGNFHEDTAKIYADLGLFTADKRLTSEAARVFNKLETNKNPREDFKHLLVGQFNLREDLVKMIDREIAFAKAGKTGKMILKMNSLQDGAMINKLYEASNAGVKIQLIIRGICCLVPGKKGFSENIEAISIVDRYLEHARVFVFHNGGKDDMYLSSADWMVRNLTYRIETAFPVYDKTLKGEIMDHLDMQLADNQKSRRLNESQDNQYVETAVELPVRSQHETYYYLKRKMEEI